MKPLMQSTLMLIGRYVARLRDSGRCRNYRWNTLRYRDACEAVFRSRSAESPGGRAAATNHEDLQPLGG